MLRIVFSRAALFPWLGIVLMAAGAAFPEDSTAGIVLVVIGANVAFYSLRDFSQHFTWGPLARPMLNLCGLLFLLGLGLAAAAIQVDALHRWLALVSTGLYLCLFAVWIAQQPLGGAFIVLAVAASLLMILGGIFARLGWQDWQVMAESQENPQEITLADLQRDGFGSNRYIRLKGFRFCDRFAMDTPEKQNRVNDLWIPVVEVDGQAVKKDGPAPAIPARIRTVAALVSLGNPGVPGPPLAARSPFELQRRRWEADGYECTVVTGIRKLKPEVRQQLSQWAPQTDFADVVVLDWRKPGSPGHVYGCLGGGGAGLLLGLSLLGFMYYRARKVVGDRGWPSGDDSAWGPHPEESAAGEDPSAAADPAGR